MSIGGIVSGLRPLKTRKGDRMCVFMLDDATGSIEVVVFPETFKQYGHLGENGQMVLVKGQVRARRRVGAILASEICPSTSSASGWPSRWRSACRRRRTTATRS
jgi:DNA polymerase-3 subunit alpha